LLDKYNKNNNQTFKFNPKMFGYYCDNDNKCKEISLEKMIIDENGVGTYNGLAIGRNPGCFGICGYKVKNQPLLTKFKQYSDTTEDVTSNNWIIIATVTASVAFFFFIIYLLYKTKLFCVYNAK
jgi:hypothetical protein